MNDATTALLTEHFSYTPLVSFARSSLSNISDLLLPRHNTAIITNEGIGWDSH